MEQPLAAAALALDFILQLPSQSGTPPSGVPIPQRELFEPEIRKQQGQIITSDASDNLVALFPKTVSAVICALSLHRMFAALSQSLPELENFRLRIGIHAEPTTEDHTQAQQKCIAIARELKDLALRGNILVSHAVVSTIDERWPVKLKRAGEYKPSTAPEAFDIFELMPPQIKPLPVIQRRRRFAQLRLPLAASVGLFILGGTGCSYLYQAGAVEWPPALGLWLDTARVTAQQIDSSIEMRARAIVNREPSISRGDALLKAAASHWRPRELSDSSEIRVASSEGATSSQPPISRGEALQRAASSFWKTSEPLPDSDEASIGAMDEPAEDAAIVLPAKPDSQQSLPLPAEKTAKLQQVTGATEVPAKPEVTMPVQGVSAVSPRQPEEQQQPQQQKLKAESTRIAAAITSEKLVAPEARPAQSTSPAASELTALDPIAESPPAKPEPSVTTVSQMQQEPKGESAGTAALSAQKPSAPPAQISQPAVQLPVQQTEQVASLTPAVVNQTAPTAPLAAEAERSGPILLQQPTFATKSPAQAPQNSATATEKLFEPEQGPSAAAPQAEPPKRQAELSPTQLDISAPEQPSTQAPVESETISPKAASLATEIATGNATKLEVVAPAKLRAPKAQLETETVEAQVQDCNALRKAFRRGTLVRSVDKAAYSRLVACQRLKSDQRQRSPERVAGKASNQGTNQPGSDGGASSGSNTGGPGNSGGNGNGKGKNK